MEFEKRNDSRLKLLCCYKGLGFFLKGSIGDDYLPYVLEAADIPKSGKSQPPKSGKSQQSKVCLSGSLGMYIF